VEVEFFFMGGGSLKRWQATEINHSLGYARISVLNPAAQPLDEESGRYRFRNAVPT
jgi:hypothetical protein